MFDTMENLVFFLLYRVFDILIKLIIFNLVGLSLLFRENNERTREQSFLVFFSISSIDILNLVIFNVIGLSLLF